jgi:transposase-like protein
LDTHLGYEKHDVKNKQTNVTGIEDQIIALYSKGVSTRDIQDHLQGLYGIEVSPTLISNVTNKIVPLIKEWQNRPLQQVYAVVFLEAIHFKVKQEPLPLAILRQIYKNALFIKSAIPPVTYPTRISRK